MGKGHINLASTIRDPNDAIGLLDAFENTRELTGNEWNFRVLLKQLHASLVVKQKLFWR